MQQVRGLEVGYVEVRELDVFPGPPTGTCGHRAPRRRGERGFRGALRRRRRYGVRSPRAQATGSGRLTRVFHRRYLDRYEDD